jgi:hypothetical protein
MGIGNTFAPTVTYRADRSLLDTTNFQSAGAGGNGFWFANFGTAAPETNQPVAQNAANQLPNWATLPVDAWEGSAFSSGGGPDFDVFTLPNGASGRSGSVVDPSEAGNPGQSNALLGRLLLGPGTPSNFIMWVVVDNEDAAANTAVRRVKARLIRGSTVVEADTGDGIDALRNFTADAYAFHYPGALPGDEIQINLRTTEIGLANNGTSMAGFMFTVIPEPSSIVPSALGLIGSLLVHRRK